MGVKLREERRLRVFENRVLREIFGPKRDEVTGEWRKLHNENLSDLYCSPHIRYSGYPMKKSKIGGACSTYEEDERSKEGFGGEPDRNKQLGRPSLRWENDIKIDQEV